MDRTQALDRVEESFKQVATENGLLEDQLVILSRDFGIFSIKTMTHFFEPEEVHANFGEQLFHKVKEWENQMWVLPRLRQTWLACSSLWARQTTLGTSTKEANLEDPLSPEVHTKLSTAFEAKHGFRPPTSRICAEPVVARFYRCLQARRMEDIVIEILPTGDDVITTTVQPAKLQLARGLELRVPGTQRAKLKKLKDIKSPHEYLWALEAWAFTLSTAGCYKVSVPKKEGDSGTNEERFMVEFQDLMDHCARAGAFVSVHLLGKQKLEAPYILKELERIDKAIRFKWADDFRRATSDTYSDVIRSAENRGFVERHWSKDYHPLLEVEERADKSGSRRDGRRREGDGGGGGKEPKRRKTLREGGEGRKARRSRSRSRSEKTKPQSPQAEHKPKAQEGLMRGIRIKVMSGRSFRKERAQRFCRAFESERGCPKTDCKQRHHCDVMLESGLACDKPHSRQQHDEADGKWTPV